MMIERADPMFRRYPSLLDAPPPEPLLDERSDVDRDELYAAAREFWDGLMRDGVAFREPVGDVVHVPSRGYCLEPLFAGDGVATVSPRLPARHGDLVMLQDKQSNRDAELALARADAERGDAEAKRWLSTYGSSRTLCVTKFLMAYGGRYWTVFSPEASQFFVAPLESYAAILGVVVGYHAQVAALNILGRIDRLRTVTPRYIEGDRVQRTLVTTVTATDTDVFVTGSTSVNVGSVSQAALGYESLQTVTVTGVVDHHAPSAQFSTWVSIANFDLAGDSVAGSDGHIARNPSTALPDVNAAFSFQKTYTVAANTATEYFVNGQAGSAGSISGAYSYLRNVVIKLEVVPAP